MISVFITTAFAHEGEHLPTQPEISYASFGTGAQIATAVILVLIVVIGALVIIYNKNAHKAK